MNPNLMMSIRTLLVDPDRPDQDALFVVLKNWEAANILSCLAPPGTLAQIAAALGSRWAWGCDGWERQIDELVGLITDPRYSIPEQMIMTWSFIPNAVGVLRDRTDTLIAWAQQRLLPVWYDDLAILLGPSDASARLLMRSPSSVNIGTTLRLWSMEVDPEDPTAWQAMIDPDLRTALHQSANPSRAFPAWGWVPSVDSETVLRQIVNDIIDGWSFDHPSIRGRITWVEKHVDSNLRVGDLAFLASIGGSDTLAEAVCDPITHDPLSIPRIAADVPWSRLHPRIQDWIDKTMRRASNPTGACVIGPEPVERVPTIDPTILLWRIDRARWEGLDPFHRAALVSSIDPPDHCYGWGVHPDLVARKSHPHGQVFRFWTPDVPPVDLFAWAYADRFLKQTSLQESQEMITLLDTLPPNRRERVAQIIDWRLGSRTEPTAQPLWDWTTWNAFPATDRQQRLRDQLAVLWGSRDTSPAVRFWRARNDGLATLALMVGEVLGLDDPSPIIAALLAQIPALQRNTTDVESSLPFPDNLNDAMRAQIERLPLDRNAQAYAAWCLWVLARRADAGADLLALHPDVAVALAPLLSPDQQNAVAASPAIQGWESMTHLRWVAACAAAEEPTMMPIQRRIR